MKDRKLHVLTCAHKLFIEKGFQATSIQDILDESGIAKGTLYNYFSSKNELLMALFKTLYQKMEQERNDLLIGQDPTCIDIFVQQIQLQMETNRANKLISLFEEVIFLNDPELKEFIRQGQMRMLRWVHQRFREIFGDDKHPYLLDCAIMFLGILNHNIKYYGMANNKKIDIHRVVQYSVNRLVTLVDDAVKSGEVLLGGDVVNRWMPDSAKGEYSLSQEVLYTIANLKKSIQDSKEQPKYEELLDFIQEELLGGINTHQPRRFLVESAVGSLAESSSVFQAEDLEKLKVFVKLCLVR